MRIAYEVQPDERDPERILILAISAKPDIYDAADSIHRSGAS